jgi:hypothetical protein
LQHRIRVSKCSFTATALAAAALATGTALAAASVEPYAEAAGGEYVVELLYSVNDEATEAGDPTRFYRMARIRTWLSDAQAHAPPTSGTHEDGRLFPSHEPIQ